MTLTDDSSLLSKALDEIEDHIGVIARNGDIVFVNEKWTRFGIENGFRSSHSWLATNYLRVCDKKVVTVSAGVVAGIPKTSTLDFSIIDLADKCLYKSKHNGRNRIESSDF